MRTLAIDTATRACSVALFDGPNLVEGFFEKIGRGHAEKLMPMIAALPDQGKADQIAVNVGPGSFTGIRVGISAAKALALAWSAECFGYGCLAMVAAVARAASGHTHPVDVVMTGGHGEYFFQHFGGSGMPLDHAISLPLDSIVTSLSAPILAGDVVEMFEMHSPKTKYLNLLPDARQWNLLMQVPTLAPSAVYGRPPDAKTIAERQK